MTGSSRLDRGAVLVPVKDFRVAKARLAGYLQPGQRAELARRMAERVVAAAAPLPVYVVCDDSEVRAWARRQGADVIWSPGRGLNGAVTDGVALLAAEGFDDVLVAHADLPHAAHLAALRDRAEPVLIVPDRHGDGTNVIRVPSASGFTFGYGPGSFGQHRREADRLGLAARVIHDEALGWDVDLPRDLDAALAAELGITLPADAVATARPALEAGPCL